MAEKHSALLTPYDAFFHGLGHEEPLRLQRPRGRSRAASGQQAMRNLCRPCENAQAIISLSLSKILRF
jgi:hypothetical protein